MQSTPPKSPAVCLLDTTSLLPPAAFTVLIPTINRLSFPGTAFAALIKYDFRVAATIGAVDAGHSSRGLAGLAIIYWPLCGGLSGVYPRLGFDLGRGRYLWILARHLPRARRQWLERSMQPVNHPLPVAGLGSEIFREISKDGSFENSRRGGRLENCLSDPSFPHHAV